MPHLLYLFTTDRCNLAAAGIEKILAGTRPISKTWHSDLADRKSESLLPAMHMVNDCNRPMKLIYVAVSDRIAPGDTESRTREQDANVHGPNERELSHRSGSGAALQLRIHLSRSTSTRNAKERLAAAIG